MRKKTVSIMQPYLFPYIGYFQLVNAAKEFVFYDDVNFIKRGWINRNNILVNGKSYKFTVPIDTPSQFKKIEKTHIKKDLYDIWVTKFLKTIHQSYRKAPYYDEVYFFLEKVFLNSKIKSISDLSSNSIIETSNYLNLKTNFHFSSIAFSNSEPLERAERLVSIVSKLESTDYINSIGGVDIYNKSFFMEHNIHLSFLDSEITTYKQFNNDFIPGLSIIDILMFNSKEEINEMLKAYKLV